jgi:hypothetical protein
VFINGALAGSSTTNNYTATGLTPSTSYSFTVTAHDFSNNVSQPSAPLSVTTAAVAIAPPAQVQMNSNIATNGNSVASQFAASTNAGNLIVAYVVYDNTGTAAVADSAGNTYQSAVGPTPYGSGNAWRAQIFYAKNIKGGAVNVTATFSTSLKSFGLIYIHEYSGLDPINPLDAVASTAGTSSAMSSGSLTTTAGNDLLFGAGSSDNSVVTFSPGFTTRSVAFGNLTEDEVASSIGAFTATATQSGSVWVMQLVAFKAAH